MVLSLFAAAGAAHEVEADVDRDLRQLVDDLAALLFRDPKTTGIRTDLYTDFGDDEAAWKAELLRFHDTQHQRNLNTRGHGLDDRILAVNRTIADELGLEEPYAEAFEVELFGMER